MYTPQKATGSFTGNGSDVYQKIGFKPVYVRVINVSDGVITETQEGLAPNAINTVTGGSVSITVASNKIVIDDFGFTFKGTTNDKNYVFFALG